MTPISVLPGALLVLFIVQAEARGKSLVYDQMVSMCAGGLMECSCRGPLGFFEFLGSFVLTLLYVCP